MHINDPKYYDSNREWWDEAVDIHADAPSYRLKEFIAGENKLDRIIRTQLGDIRSKTLLHLQCHFGMDALCMARLGATVMGVDFSLKAIAFARELAQKAGLAATFVKADVLRLRESISDTCDIVFTSYGVLPWLGDLDAWGRNIAASLKPGGRFILVESHPFSMTLNDGSEEIGFLFDYFHKPVPTAFDGRYRHGARQRRSSHHGCRRIPVHVLQGSAISGKARRRILAVAGRVYSTAADVLAASDKVKTIHINGQACPLKSWRGLGLAG